MRSSVNASLRAVSSGPRADRVVLSCEHGKNRVPARYASLFTRAGRALRSHRGYDIGALQVAKTIARRLEAPLHAATISRLVADTNRSRHHPGLFSEYTRSLPADEKNRILRRYYEPYRQGIIDDIVRRIKAGHRVVHLSVHSFTPVLGGRRRNVDLGILYDPSRSAERQLAGRLLRLLRAATSGLVVRSNSPYRGRSDGVTKSFRQIFPGRVYLGLELEVNQRLVRKDAVSAAALARIVGDALAGLLRG
jgi:predicted N-formylglutamate amidohydrolase